MFLNRSKAPLAIQLLWGQTLALVIGLASMILGDALAISPYISASVSLILGLLVAALMNFAVLAPLRSVYRALAGTMASYRDQEYGFSIRWEGAVDVKELVEAHNQLGQVLREERQGLVQRELLLNTMVSSVPMGMVLVGAHQRVVFDNPEARRLLRDGRKLMGYKFEEICAELHPVFAKALAEPGAAVVTIPSSDKEGEEEVYTLAQHIFRLNGVIHKLFLVRRATHEFKRQEVASWKKVIRVMSHELNNSLAPISSLAYSGTQLLARGETQKIGFILETIASRAAHLKIFLGGYASFAKLSAPNLTSEYIPQFYDRLASQLHFGAESKVSSLWCRFDVGQLEQALLNVLKNALESGSDANEVQLSIFRVADILYFEVLDRGPGMKASALENALVPFFSTKRQGTGLGLALAQEIVEAHGGGLSLANREGGGLSVTLRIPFVAGEASAPSS